LSHFSFFIFHFSLRIPKAFYDDWIKVADDEALHFKFNPFGVGAPLISLRYVAPVTIHILALRGNNLKS